MKRKKVIIISALAVVAIVVGIVFSISTRKTIIIDIPYAPTVIKTNARTVRGALKKAGVVYREDVSKVNGHVYIEPVPKIRVNGKVVLPISEAYAFRLELNNNAVRLNAPIKDYDTIAIREERIVFY